MDKAKYRIIRTNTYWKYHVEKKVFGIWWHVYSTDHENFAEHYINPCENIRYFDKEGNEL